MPELIDLSKLDEISSPAMSDRNLGSMKLTEPLKMQLAVSNLKLHATLGSNSIVSKPKGEKSTFYNVTSNDPDARTKIETSTTLQLKTHSGLPAYLLTDNEVDHPKTYQEQTTSSHHIHRGSMSTLSKTPIDSGPSTSMPELLNHKEEAAEVLRPRFSSSPVSSIAEEEEDDEEEEGALVMDIEEEKSKFSTPRPTQRPGHPWFDGSGANWVPSQSGSNMRRIEADDLDNLDSLDRHGFQTFPPGSSSVSVFQDKPLQAKVECPHCNRWYGKYYINKHMADQHH